MPFTARQLQKLEKVVALANALLREAKAVDVAAPKRSVTQAQRTRRSGKELVSFRKMLKAERKKGVGVRELAAKHGVSTAYIYQL